MAPDDVQFEVDVRLGRYADLASLARTQAGALSRAQTLRRGMSAKAIECSLAARRWQVIHPGVYALFTGPLPQESRVGRRWPGPAMAVAWRGRRRCVTSD